MGRSQLRVSRSTFFPSPQMVLHLKQKVVELREELALATGEEREGELSEAETEK